MITPIALLLSASILSASLPNEQPSPVSQAAYVKSSNTSFSQLFGFSVAASGNTVVIGAPFEGSASTGVNGDQTSMGAPFSGAAYVFVRNGGVWSQEAYLKASNTQSSDTFGDAVAIYGDTILVGARGEDSNSNTINGDQNDNSAPFAGAVYVFVRNNGAWSQEAYLKASNANANDLFGHTIAVSDDLAIVGALQEDSAAAGINGDQSDNSAVHSGAAYVFRRSGSTWVQEAYLKSDTAEFAQSFGGSVAASGESLAVGCRLDGPGGAAYVFTHDGSGWVREARLVPSNSDQGDVFGSSVSLWQNTLVVGAVGEDSGASGVNGDESDNDIQASGAAYVFERSGSSWNQTAYLKASNPDGSDAFGSTSVFGNMILIGAQNEDSTATGVNGDQTNNGGFQAGAAYLFRKLGDTWQQVAYLKPSTAPCPSSSGPDFGRALALSSDFAVVGGPGDGTDAVGIDGTYTVDDWQSGAAWIFDTVPDAPLIYCTAKPSSAGCIAQIGTSSPAHQPVSGAGGYSVTACSVPEGKNGLLFVGVSGPGALPFNGGTLCALPPTKRGVIMSSGGDNPSECDGSFSTLVNDGLIIPFGMDAGAGNSAWYQYWLRDPQNGAGQLGTALSNAVQLDFL